jgi:hypothetical protein
MWVCLLILAACATPPTVDRRQQADGIAATAGWQALDISADPFVLRAYAPTQFPASKTLTLYIEGDGQAWVSSDRPSDDPTPTQPLALQLAVRNATQSAAYLARPCQYVQAETRGGCESAYWTGKRFAPEIIAATNRAVDRLKQRAGAIQLVLIGYSGGGAVAALVAAQRQDVLRLVTVAGNLDHVAWTKLHHVSPLQGSLNPVDAWAALQRIPQVHFVGASDTTMPESIALAYRAHLSANAPIEIRIMPGFDHHCCWVEQWPALLGE